MAKPKKKENDSEIGLFFAVGIMLIVGGIFTLPFGLWGIIIGFGIIYVTSRKIDNLKK